MLPWSSKVYLGNSLQKRLVETYQGHSEPGTFHGTDYLTQSLIHDRCFGCSSARNPDTNWLFLLTCHLIYGDGSPVQKDHRPN